MPIWVRVSGAIAVALLVVVVGSMLLGGSRMDGVHHTGPPTGSAAPGPGATPPHVRPSH